jgi:hypothetical protein
MKKVLTVLSIVSMILIASSQAQAVALFTDRTAFLAATTGMTNIDFEENSYGAFTYYPSGATFSGVNFVGSGYLYTIDPALATSIYDWDSGDILSDQYETGPINVALPGGGFTAVGSDIMSFDPYASDFIITLSTGDVFTVSSANYPTRAFVGFTSNVPISWLTFDATSSVYANLDNFVFGSAGITPIPEPATLSLLGFGLLGLAGLRKKRS